MKFYTLDEIKKKAKKESDNPRNMGYFVKMNAGNVPLGNAIFNGEAVATADGGVGPVTMGESLNPKFSLNTIWNTIVTLKDEDESLADKVNNYLVDMTGETRGTKPRFELDTIHNAIMTMSNEEEEFANKVVDYLKERSSELNEDVSLDSDYQDKDFQPFFFDDPEMDEGWWLSEATYVADHLKPEDHMDNYGNYDDFLDTEFTARVLGSYGSPRENEEMKKWFEINYPQKAKVAKKLFESLSESQQLNESKRVDVSSKLSSIIPRILKMLKLRLRAAELVYWKEAKATNLTFRTSLGGGIYATILIGKYAMGDKPWFDIESGEYESYAKIGIHMDGKAEYWYTWGKGNKPKEELIDSLKNNIDKIESKFYSKLKVFEETNNIDLESMINESIEEVDESEEYQKIRDLIYKANHESSNEWEAFNILYDNLVDKNGKSKTLAGEIVRAMMHLYYGYQNLGIRFDEEEALFNNGIANSAEFLLDSNLDPTLTQYITFTVKGGLNYDKEYDYMLDDMMKVIVWALVPDDGKEIPKEYFESNAQDSRLKKPMFIEDNIKKK